MRLTCVRGAGSAGAELSADGEAPGDSRHMARVPFPTSLLGMSRDGGVAGFTAHVTRVPLPPFALSFVLCERLATREGESSRGDSHAFCGCELSVSVTCVARA